MLAPICLFTYNRLTELQQTVAALQQNFLASESELIVFSDGAKNAASQSKVDAVRQYIHTIIGFKTVQIIESPVNKGLANSIIGGVTQVLEQYGKVIVLEDDLITSRNFLDYMNQSLDFYASNDRILSVSGFSFSKSVLKTYTSDISFGLRASSWGWATWKNRWEKIDWSVKTYRSFKCNWLKRWKFNLGGSDLSNMLDNQMAGEIDSWAIRFCYHQFQHNLLDVFPIQSKVTNIGFGTEATNNKRGCFRFSTTLDVSNVRVFSLLDKIKLNKSLLLKAYWPHSIFMRIIARLLSNNTSSRQLKMVEKTYAENVLLPTPSTQKVPVLFIIFNRPDNTKRVFDTIKKYKPDKLYIASDGARMNIPSEAETVEQTRQQVLAGIDWVCEVKTIFRTQNLGCGGGPYEAINWFFEHEEMGIILEDDCVPSPVFYDYCNYLLEKFKYDSRVSMISGRSHYPDHKLFEQYDYIFSYNCITWGWATWRRCWANFDIDMKNWDAFNAEGGFKNLCFTKSEGAFLNGMFSRLVKKTDYQSHVWDFQFVFSILAKAGMSIVPAVNLVENIGYDGTHFDGITKLQKLKSSNNYKITSEPNFVLPNRHYETYYFHKTILTKINNVLMRVIRKILK